MRARESAPDKHTNSRVLEEASAFQTLRPPHLLEGLAVFALMFPIVGFSITLAMLHYSWLSFHLGVLVTLASALFVVIPQVLVITGRPQAVFAIQALALMYVLLPISLIVVGPFHWFMVIPVVLTFALIAISRSRRYWMFVLFYKVIWDRHRAQK